MNKATWTDGKRTVSGRWEYYYPGDFFRIILDKPDSITIDDDVFMVRKTAAGLYTLPVLAERKK